MIQEKDKKKLPACFDEGERLNILYTHLPGKLSSSHNKADCFIFTDESLLGVILSNKVSYVTCKKNKLLLPPSSELDGKNINI